MRLIGLQVRGFWSKNSKFKIWPKITVFGEPGVLNFPFWFCDTEKAHPYAKLRLLTYFALKSVPAYWLSVIGRTHIKRTTAESTLGVESHACVETNQDEIFAG